MTKHLVEELSRQLKEIQSRPIDEVQIEKKLRALETLIYQHLNFVLASALQDLANDLKSKENSDETHPFFFDKLEKSVSLATVAGQDLQFFSDLIITMKLGARVLYEEGLLTGSEWDRAHGNTKF